MDLHPPFILFDSADGADEQAWLYTRPHALILAQTPADVPDALELAQVALRRGEHLAGWLGYDAGHALEARLAGRARPAPDGLPILCLGRFSAPQALDRESQDAFWWRQWRGCGAAGLERPISERDYARDIASIQALIAAGDVYQINHTYLARVSARLAPLPFYAALRASQRARYGVLSTLRERWILGQSPELFFRMDALGGVTARPMKGTAPRRAEPDADAAAARALQTDAKNRAENLMIVDLIRNDLSRIAHPGSVRVPALFDIESLPTVHQMTSTVAADLPAGTSAVDVLRALFPCGSITGAPKIRAMEIIAGHEPSGRGLYTGTMGWMAPDGRACFNIAIRTLVGAATASVRDAPRHYLVGFGSGIVADSQALDEWRECADKARFLDAAIPPFDLIETLRWTVDVGYVRLDRHLGRLLRSARHWGFTCDQSFISSTLEMAASRWTRDMRVRLLLSRCGALVVQATGLPAPVHRPMRLAISAVRANPDDPLIYHKTSRRAWYDDARIARQGEVDCDEVLFLNRDGALTEGSLTNLFLRQAPDGPLLTPRLSAGLLPGVLRQELLEKGDAQEADLTVDMLRDAAEIFVGNSLRGLIAARITDPSLLSVKPANTSAPACG